jgi:hypothetical protein
MKDMVFHDIGDIRFEEVAEPRIEESIAGGVIDPMKILTPVKTDAVCGRSPIRTAAGGHPVWFLSFSGLPLGMLILAQLVRPGCVCSGNGWTRFARLPAGAGCTETGLRRGNARRRDVHVCRYGIGNFPWLVRYRARPHDNRGHHGNGAAGAHHGLSRYCRSKSHGTPISSAADD